MVSEGFSLVCVPGHHMLVTVTVSEHGANYGDRLYISFIKKMACLNAVYLKHCQTNSAGNSIWYLKLALSLTHWGWVTHICVGNLTIIGSDNGVSPCRSQAIIWTNAGTLLIGPLGTNFSENLIEILTFSFTKIRLKVSSAKWRPFCLGLNVLMVQKFEVICSVAARYRKSISIIGLVVSIYIYASSKHLF